jgi:hypothetical protein
MNNCKHVLIPGETHCLACGQQILYTDLGRTRLQRFAAWVAGWWSFLAAPDEFTGIRDDSTALPARGSADPQADHDSISANNQEGSHV